MVDLPPLLTAQGVADSSKGALSASDVRIDPLIKGVSSALRRYCGWHVAPVIDDQATLDTDGSGLLRLPTLRLVELTSIAVLGQERPVGDVEWSHTGLVRGTFPNRFRSTVVGFRHGFEDVEALSMIAAQVIRMALSSPMGATREQAGALGVSWATTAPGVAGGVVFMARDYDLLNAYRLERVA